MWLSVLLRDFVAAFLVVSTHSARNATAGVDARRAERGNHIAKHGRGGDAAAVKANTSGSVGLTW